MISVVDRNHSAITVLDLGPLPSSQPSGSIGLFVMYYDTADNLTRMANLMHSGHIQTDAWTKGRDG